MSRPHHEVLEGSETGPWEPVGDVDLERLDLPTRVFGLANLALFLCLLLPWYTRGAPAPAGSASAMVAGGWRWLIWLLSLAGVVFVFLESVTSLRLPAFLTNARERGQVFAAAAGADLVLVLIAAFVAKSQPPSLFPVPPGTGVATAFGAYLGLLAAVAALVSAVPGLFDRALRHSPGRAGEPGPGARPGRAYRPAAGPDPGPAADGSSAPPGADSRSGGPSPAGPAPHRSRQRPASQGSDPPTGWMPPQPPPPPPL